MSEPDLSANEQQTVLFVDDEANILHAFERLCRKEAFTIRVANGAEEALQQLGQFSIDLIVSDLRMPGMDGSDLLAEVSRKYPDVVRVLVSGNADLPAVIKAVNEGQLSYYLPKPWKDDDVRIALRKLLEKKALEKKYKTLLETVSRQNLRLSEHAAEIAKETVSKNRFFAMMSHEIRTPLNGVHGLLQVLNDRSDLSAESRRLLEIAMASSAHLGHIVNDALDHAKIESGEMVLETRIFSLQHLLKDVNNLLQPIAASKNIELTLADNVPTADCFFEGDDTRIRQVLINLVSNAVKFTRNGYVRIGVPSVEDQLLIIEVRDTGIGIAEDRQHLLFEEFKMLEDSHAREFGGTGLGLNICKRLVELMRGEISVESEPGKGSTFRINLPLPRLKKGDTDLIQAVDKPDLTGCFYLVVDDNETNLMVIEAMLQQMGATVLLAGSGEQALEVLQSHSSDIQMVFTDISMLGMDGVKLARAIRDRGLVERDVPIIAMTAHVHPDEREKFLSSGLTGILAKPFQLAELIQVLAAVRVEDNQFSSEDFSHDTFLQLKRDTGKEVIQRLVESFVKDSSNRLRILEKTCSEQDWAGFVNEAHALGSSAGMFGATKLYRTCREIERMFKENDFSTLELRAPGLIILVRPAVEQVARWLG